MMLAAFIAGEFDLLAFHMIDGAHLAAVGADDRHVLADILVMHLRLSFPFRCWALHDALF